MTSTTDVQPGLDELLAPMLKRRLFVVFSDPVDAHVLRANLVDHLRFLIGLEERGVLFAAGPFCHANGEPSASGMMILRANDLGEAQAITAADPLHVSGAREFTVREWLLNEGHVGIGVRFSNQSYHLD